MTNTYAKPLIVQGDNSILLEVDNPLYEEARNALAGFAELVKSPDHIHTYRLTPLSIWNATAAGISTENIISPLKHFSRYDIPEHIIVGIRDYAARYGKLKLKLCNGKLELSATDLPLAEEIWRQKDVRNLIEKRISPLSFTLPPLNRGRLKQALIRIGYPAEDLAGYIEGDSLPVFLRETTESGEQFSLRPYQKQAVNVFHADGAITGGSGVVVLPCGAGKTVVGIGTISSVSTSTLILSTGVTAARQWIREILDKTSLNEEEIGEYTGHKKDIRPVTVTTYQTLVHRRRKDEPFTHFELFNKRNWGLIIYDEVHLLPAPVFQVTAEIQARRRLGLTATLVREDGREEDVFALIGPKKYDAPWKLMEKQGWIAKATCTEVRVSLTDEVRMEYAIAPKRSKFRIASENRRKIPVIQKLLSKHPDSPTLIIGMYIDQLKKIAKTLNIPILTGQTSAKKREELFSCFRSGDLRILAVSKVANFAVDLPDAAVAVQVSGTFGSRQEEAQRLGRLLRPKKGENQAHFYTVVTRDTVEQDFAHNRQLFLTEQGYSYAIVGDDEIEKI